MKVVIYTSTGCPYCEKIKKDLQQWGMSDYEERNVTVQPDFFNDLHERGIFSTPVTFLDEQPVIGYRPNKMRQTLEEKGVLTKGKKKVEGENPASAGNPSSDQEVVFEPLTADLLAETYDFVAIGGGPAGASAAVYAARANLKTLVIDKAPTSGTLTITHKIANYPGVREELTGQELLERIQGQAKAFGTTFVQSHVLSVDFSDEIKILETAEGKIKAKTVFIAVGAKAPSSKIKGEEEFTGRGVSYCSTCDAAFFKGKTVAVVGDTEEAVAEAIALSKHAAKVLFLIPGSQLKGEVSITEVEQVPNISVYWKHRLKEIAGDLKLEGIKVLNDQREEAIWHVDGVFLYLAGMKPGTDFLKDQIKRDEEGYILVDEYLRTSADGVFAGGDARRTPIKQAVISAADGAIAAMSADQHVNRRKKVRPQYS